MTQRPKEGFRRTLGGSWLILRDRRLWPVFAMAFVGYASIFCIMGVWGGVYLHEVHGLDLVERGYALLAMAIAFALGLFLFGRLARRLGRMKLAVVGGAVLAIPPFAVLARPEERPVGTEGV